MPLARFRPSIRRASRAALRDRRGATTAAMAVGATALLGMAALASEGGLWFLQRRDAQSAADAAAYAGAVALSLQRDAVAIGLDTARRNGFDDADPKVTVTITPGTNRVTALVEQMQFIGLGRVISDTPPTARARAVAEIRLNVNGACILALGNVRRALTISGSNITTGSECVLASNSTQREAFYIGGDAADVDVHGLVSSGECAGCTEPVIGADTEVHSFMPPVTNPYAILDSKDLSGVTCGGAPQQTSTDGNVTWTLTPGSTNAICQSGVGGNGTISLTSGDVMDLSPGTYYFVGTSLSVSGGTLTCSSCSTGGPGVTLIFASDGSETGTFSFNGNGLVQLNAPAASPDDSDFDGLLMWREDGPLPNNPRNAQNTISINGNALSVMDGAIYAPTSHIEYSGTMGGTNACTLLIAYVVTLTGNSNLDLSSCTQSNSDEPIVRVVKLVE